MHVLITGGTGFVGQALQKYLVKAGHEVRILSRKSGWDVGNQTIDPRVLDGIDAIVHLAGAGIADKRWTAARKKELISSRVDSTRLLARVLRTEKHQVHTFVSASAIGKNQ
jgi:NAD dependent epimerase/dehydratase family enzyme